MSYQLIQDFYNELKKNNTNNFRIKELAKTVPLTDKFIDIDPLTFAIFYQNKIAFHILLNRGIDINPTIYKDIPPLLWSLEIQDNYFLLQLLKRTSVDLFCIEKTFGENLLSNICLKIQDLKLFRKVFKTMEKANVSALKSLITTRVKIDEKLIFPIEICLYALNFRIRMDISNRKEAEIICFEKIKILLYFQMKYTNINLLGILEIIPNFYNIMNYNSCLIEKIVDFIGNCTNLPELLKNNSGIINNSIANNHIKFTKILLSCACLDDLKLGEHLKFALKHGINNIIEYLIKLGANLNSIEDKPDLIITVIANDNLQLYRSLTLTDKYKYYIWQEKYSSTNQPIPFDFPVNYRALHLACAFESIKIATYLIESVGDSLTYKNKSKKSPIDILEIGIIQGHIKQTFTNEIICPRISFQRFQREDTLRQKECSICLDTLCGKDITLLKCGHAFHSSCLRKNKEISLKCPYCRALVSHKYKSNGKFALLEPKVILKPEKISLSKCYNIEKVNVCIPVKSKTEEDILSYLIYQGDDLEKLVKEQNKKLHKNFLDKMEIAEKPLLLQRVRKILIKHNIGKRPKNMINPNIYDFRKDNEYHNPPGTPVPRKKFPIKSKTLENNNRRAIRSTGRISNYLFTEY